MLLSSKVCLLVSSTSHEIRKPEFTAHGKNQQTPFASEVDVHFLVEMGCMSLTACDRNGLYSALKIAAGIDTLKVTLDLYYYFLSGSVGGGGLPYDNHNNTGNLF